jgi:hypothetical protein
MQSYLCIGGNHDGLNYPAHADAETVQWPVGATDKEIYTRSTLSVGDVSIMIYIHESLTPEQALNRLVEHCPVSTPQKYSRLSRLGRIWRASRRNDG